MPKASKASALKAFYIKMIHSLKHNYFIDDECRKIYLQSVYNKDSLTDLSIDELREVLEVCGYKSKLKRKVKENLKPRRGFGFATAKQLDTITGIWNEVARVKTEIALREFIYRIIKIRPLHLNALKREDASNVIRALKNMKELHKNVK